jgi:hypothetical protein
VIPFGIHRRIPLVRRPFYQRDQAIRERDELAAELHLLKSTAVTPQQSVEDDHGALVERIIAAYEQSVGVTQQSDSFWDNAFFNRKREIHDALCMPSIPTGSRSRPQWLHSPNPDAHPVADAVIVHSALIRRRTGRRERGSASLAVDAA